jgi:hypothetical protein
MQWLSFSALRSIGVSSGSATVPAPSPGLWKPASDAVRDEWSSADLGRCQIPCLIFIGAADADFLERARGAAEEVPDAELLVLEEADHYAAHMSQDELLVDATVRTLRPPA